MTRSFHADTRAPCGTGGITLMSAHDLSRADPSRLRRTGAVAAPLPDLAAGVAESGAAAGRYRPLRGVCSDNGRPQRWPARRHLVPELVAVGRPRRTTAGRAGLGYLPHRRQLPGRLGGLRAGTSRPGAHGYRHRAGRRLDPLGPDQIRGDRQVRQWAAVLGTGSLGRAARVAAAFQSSARHSADQRITGRGQ